MKISETISAVVTGGASGLGLEAARALAAGGVKVAIFDLDRERGEEVANEIGGMYCSVNVASETEVDDGFERARAKHGQERILVNCAGTAKNGKTASRDRKTGMIRRFPTNWLEQVIQVNLVGSFRCITAAAAGMMTLDPLEDGERGAVINTASIAAEDGQIGQVAYSASKAGIVGMTLTIARDLASEGIRVNTILPGIFATPPMLKAPPEALDALMRTVPFPQRLGRPAEFASLVLELIRNTYFNGQSIRLDGGIRMPPR
jgi:NAD(P)-dependent dehydrogenase (short-subunit alcohol dehydrogenase family)